MTKEERINLLSSQIDQEKEFVRYYSVNNPQHELVELAKIKIELYQRELKRLESEEK